jgi:HlyD family secretion protein
VQIDKRTPRNSLAQAQAELEAARARRDIAKAQRNRSETLFKTGTLNEVEFETSILEYANAKAEVVRAQVAVENARIALDDTEVRAPIAGTLIQRDVEKGQVISSPTMDVGGGTALLQMANLRYVQVRSLVDETDIGKIRPGQQAVVTVAAYPNQPFRGEVIKLEPKAEEEETVTLFAVIVNIDNEQGLLRPGMNAEVDIDIASRYDVPAIPAIALRTAKDIKAAAMFTGIDETEIRETLRNSGMEVQAVSGASEYPQGEGQPAAQEGQGYQFGGKYWVFVMQDDVPTPRYIQTGLTDLDYSEVISGVAAEDEVLLLPSSDLILSQDRFRKWMGDMVGVPGMSSKDD